ncbi:hypothetical protein L798_07507 [Zootermopsis nevadensis]|uniref:Uncharacterized protein n=1 Tax=Zootermopsis nevadensis TaxID=136037 RepID=A0A067R856_ZOONE|nr:hypothetical protein L798_07507 [Zootermopsis nevadensis]
MCIIFPLCEGRKVGNILVAWKACLQAYRILQPLRSFESIITTELTLPLCMLDTIDQAMRLGCPTDTCWQPQHTSECHKEDLWPSCD